jgi:hypothetical protein
MTNTLGNQSSRRKTKYDTRSADELKGTILKEQQKLEKILEQKVKEFKKPKKGEESYYFLCVEGGDYLIATPNSFASSHRTLDIYFNDLATNYKAQEKLGLASRTFIKPDVSYANPMEGEDLREAVAVYLACLQGENPKEERDAKLNYLMENNFIRILCQKDDPKDVNSTDDIDELIGLLEMG